MNACVRHIISSASAQVHRRGDETVSHMQSSASSLLYLDVWNCLTTNGLVGQALVGQLGATARSPASCASLHRPRRRCRIDQPVPWSRCIAASSIARRDRVQRRNLCTQHASHLLRMYTENRRATGWEHVVAEQAVGKSQCKLTLDFVTTQSRIHSVHKSDLVIVLSSSFMESMFLKRWCCD